MDLDTAHERAVGAFEASGYHVSPGSLLNSISDSPVAGIAKLFNAHTDDRLYTGVVYPGEWTDEATNAVLTLASRLRPGADLDGVVVVAANDPPDAVTYLTGTHPRGAFALDAMVQVQNGPEFGPDSAPHYADVGRELLADHFDISVDDPDTLATLDEVVLTQLRTADEPTSPQPGFRPREALLTIGSLAGEVMRRDLERDLPVRTGWEADDDIASTGVVMRFERTDSDDGASVNPIGKAFKLFDSGAADDFTGLHRTVQRIAREGR